MLFLKTDSVPDVHIKTEIHSTEHQPVVTYKHVPWKLKIRKESTFPVDSYDNALLVGYLFKQVGSVRVAVPRPVRKYHRVSEIL